MGGEVFLMEASNSGTSSAKCDSFAEFEDFGFDQEEVDDEFHDTDQEDEDEDEEDEGEEEEEEEGNESLEKEKSTSEKKFRCNAPGCNRTYTRADHLRRHQRTAHEGIRPFHCNLCEQTFTSNQHLKRHLLTHQSKKPYVCDFEGCNEAFAKHNQLRRHKCKHTGDLPYTCTQCNAGFQYPSQLRRHLLVHSNLRAHICGVPSCGESFDSFKGLNKHLKEAHSSDKKSKEHLTCHHCHLVLSSSQNLQSHLKTHESMREIFVCPHPDCTKSFSKKSNLRAHQKAIHEGVRFSCKFCSKEFRHKHVLHKHIRTQHPRTSVTATSTTIESVSPLGEELTTTTTTTTTTTAMTATTTEATETETETTIATASTSTTPTLTRKSKTTPNTPRKRRKVDITSPPGSIKDFIIGAQPSLKKSGTYSLF